MEALKNVERMISDKIIDDLGIIQELVTISKDPLGYTIYLYFLLKNNTRSVEVDNLIDWMNSWVENFLVQKNFSRFIDVELTSSFFAYFSLKTFRRLRIHVKFENLQTLFSEYVKNSHFFNNFTLSSLIALSLADFKSEIKEYSDLLEWIKKRVDEKNIFNDAKNLAFTSILFDKVDSKDYLKKIFNYCYERLQENNIPYHDELYYAYVLWKFRLLKDQKDELRKIREFTNESIENAKRFLFREDEDKLLKKIYGADTQKIASKISASKIYLGVFLDLLADFGKNTIVVSEEELTRKDIPLWISLGPLFSVLIFSFGIVITWFTFQLNLLIDFSMLITDPFWIDAMKFVVSASLFTLVVFLFITSVSLFWDIVFRRSGNSRIIKNNLALRLKKHVLWKVAVPLIFGFLKTFFGL